MSRGELITIIIGIFGLVLMGIQAWDVLEKRGAVVAALAISIWIASASIVGYAVFRNLKDAHRAKRAEAKGKTAMEMQLRECEKEPRAYNLKLKIHSASWGNASSRKDINAIDARPRDAWFINNETFGCDPAGAIPREVRRDRLFAYGSGSPVQVARPEGYRIVVQGFLDKERDSEGRGTVEKNYGLYVEQGRRINSLRLKERSHNIERSSIARSRDFGSNWNSHARPITRREIQI